MIKMECIQLINSKLQGNEMLDFDITIKNLIIKTENTINWKPPGNDKIN